MTEEPYRWLEAIKNRREYIRDQIKGGTPVFAVSRPEGILLIGLGQGQSKVFEIYDRHGFAALGHPVDIEKLRQSAIEAAHLEGFTRSSKDVTLRRLISFSLSMTLKNSFEQVYSPPLMVECIFAEVGLVTENDVLARVHFDGNHRYESTGVCVAHGNHQQELEAASWIRSKLKREDSLARTTTICLTAWKALIENESFENLKVPARHVASIDGKVLEAALLDRHAPAPVHYRPLNFLNIKS